MQIVGLVISWAVAIGIIGIGIGYAAKSEMNATSFGLPQLPEREARGWWRVHMHFSWVKATGLPN